MCFIVSLSPELHEKLVKQLTIYEKVYHICMYNCGHIGTSFLQVKRENRLLHVSFTTVTEYLFLLKAIARIFDPLGAIGIFYLAAAVSDFYLPAPEMVSTCTCTTITAAVYMLSHFLNGPICLAKIFRLNCQYLYTSLFVARNIHW